MRNVQKRNHTGRRYVFICGLHRSGTSLLGRNIARMENCTGFKDTGVIEDEGQFLQDVYPTAITYGGAGRFGFDSRAHLTETSVLFTPANAARLRESWHAYWDNSKTIFVEKTPGNLLKTRFLQAVFPDSYFIVIRRHPVAVEEGALYSFAYNQLDYLEDGNGSILVDFIGRFENFSEDMRMLAMKAGIQLGRITHANVSVHRHSSTYYTSELEKIVRERFARDIEYFGYDFERL